MQFLRYVWHVLIVGRRAPRSCSISVESQLAKLATLPPGWYNGDDGGEYSHRELMQVAAYVASLRLPRVPYIYPDPDGCVRVEIEDFDGDRVLEFRDGKLTFQISVSL